MFSDLLRTKLLARIVPDTHIDVVLALKPTKGPSSGNPTTVSRYAQRYGYTNTLGSLRPRNDQWLVLTENRILLFSKRGGALIQWAGPLEHELDRTDVTLHWADYNEAGLRRRLIHLTTNDQRMNISHTILDGSGEADRLVQAIAERSTEIGLHEL